jgi:hypothetical protein
VCAPAPDSCPTGYQCAADQHCWRHPLTTALDGGLDATVETLPDMGGAPDDLAVMTPADQSQSAPADMATPPECPSNALFCDGFESGAIATKWTTTYISPASAGQTLTVGNGQHHTGSLALHAAASYSADSWSLAQYNWAGTQAPLALRFWARPASALANRGMVARVLNHNDTHGYQIGGSPSGNWTISENLGTDHDSTVAVTTNAWTCLELVIPSSGEVQLFVNGGSTPAIHFTPATPGETYDELHVGVEWAPASVPVDVWIDDVALSSSALPCP